MTASSPAPRDNTGPDYGGVWIDPARRSGEPCIGGTRIPVELVIDTVWAHGVSEAMTCYDATREQVLNACWYAGAGNVVRLHGPGGEYVAKRGPWRKRWEPWAKETHQALWSGGIPPEAIPDPPTREDDR